MLLPLSSISLLPALDADYDCFHLLLEAWYLDDGVLAGERFAVICALHLIEELGPHLGLHINFSKCELFSRNGNSLFPPVVKSSLHPHLDILGGSYWGFCALLSLHCREVCNAQGPAIKVIVDVSALDLHVAFSLLRMCRSHCKLIRVARVTPLSLCTDYI